MKASEVSTVLIGVQLIKFSARDLLNGLRANVLVDHHEQNIRYLGQ